MWFKLFILLSVCLPNFDNPYWVQTLHASKLQPSKYSRPDLNFETRLLFED